MKRVLALLSIICLCLFLVACNSNSSAPNTDDVSKSDDINYEFLGVWKCQITTSVTSEGRTYRTDSVNFLQDGTATLTKDINNPTIYNGVWEYNSDEKRITLKLELGNIVYEIRDIEGKTTLKYFNDIYYRESDFNEDVSR